MQRGDGFVATARRSAPCIDAATLTLDLDVETVDGVLYLCGMVPILEDTELAAEVAARVPGLVDEMTLPWL
jgi:osmotically-inducible protein OsmY